MKSRSRVVNAGSVEFESWSKRTCVWIISSWHSGADRTSRSSSATICSDLYLESLDCKRSFNRVREWSYSRYSRSKADTTGARTICSSWA
ncbi:hypothetical protein D3C71_1946630 [compost metagenome]